MKRSVDFSLVLPCYNEADIFSESIKHIISILSLSTLSFEIIFVDDKSLDKTTYLIALVCKKYAFCQAIYHTYNQGRGKSVGDGIKKAKGKVVGYIDIDCEVSPIYIPSCIDLIVNNKADIVVGNRVYRSSIRSLVREISSVGYKLIAGLLVETRRIDTESGYKFFNRAKILPVLNKTKSSHWFWDTEIIVRSLKDKLRVIEVPVLFLRRFDKKSSVRFLPDVIDYVLQLLRLHGNLG